MRSIYSQINSHGKEQFPLHCVPEIIRNAITGVASKTKAPLPLIFASAMAPVSLICQGLIDISPAENLTFPVSCNFCTVAESGERKSTVDKLFMVSIHDYERRARLRYERELREYHLELDTWKAELSGLKNALKKNVRKNQSTEDIKKRIKIHWEDEPQIPTQLQLVASDITPAALQYLLYTGGGALLLHAAEGDIILGGQAIQNLGLLNDMWDGAPFTVSRRQSESFTVTGARLSASLMVQDAVLQKYFRRSQEQARGSGFLARFFFSRPESTIGSRTGPVLENYQDLLTPYHQSLRQLLEEYVQKTLKKEPEQRKVLTFTPEAEIRWRDICGYFEQEMAEGGEYYCLRDFASKESNKVARLAALFHYINGDEGGIPEDTLLNAQRVSEWYLHQALSLFGGEPQQPQYIQDAELLWAWLHERFLDNNGQALTRSWVSPRVPNKLRQPGRLEPALQHLHSTCRITLWHDKKTKLITPYGYSP